MRSRGEGAVGPYWWFIKGMRVFHVPFSLGRLRILRGICLTALAMSVLGCSLLQGIAYLMASAEEKSFMKEYADTTFFVSTVGRDSWSGKLCCPNADQTDGPFATPSRARVAARFLGSDVRRRIVVRGGTYYDVALDLYSKDSNLTIEAAEGETVTLYGGHRVTGWIKEEEGELWCAKLSGVKEQRWTPRMLQVNGRFCPRARLPQEGAFTHDTVFDVRWMSTTLGGWERKPTPEELTTLKYRQGDLGPWLEARNAELTIFHAWDDSTVGVRSIDRETRTLTFSNPAGHPPGAFAGWNPHARTYVVWNVREGMTKPGQWYLDRANGRVIYWPLPGEDMTTAEALMPTTESIIRIHSTGGASVEGLVLRGLSLSLTTTPLIAAGFGAGQLSGAITSDAPLVECRFENLSIRNVAGHGIKLRHKRNRRIRIEGCEIECTGAGGIYMTSDEGVITENLVAHVGLMYPGAIGIFAGGDKGLISHNDIHDTSYSGINGGGGTGNRIEYNDISRVMQVLNDGAAIYTIFAEDLIIRGNVARDIGGGPGGRHAYYLDEQSENCLVTGNLAVGVASPSHNHMARNNRIENNVFVNDGDIELHFPRSTNYVLSKNIIYATGEIEFRSIDAIDLFHKNILYSGAGRVQGIKYRPDSYQPVAVDLLPEDGDTLRADPMFVDAPSGDYRFKAGSPAHTLGIEPLDVNRVGRTKR